MADEHGPDAPGDDAPKTLGERALAAIEAAFDDEVKKRFAALCGNEYGPEGLGAALSSFAKGLNDLKECRAKAIPIVQRIFDDVASV